MLLAFIQEYFVQPVLLGTGYNWINTFVYAVLLVLIGLSVYRALRQIGVKFDGNFAVAIFPYIILGSILSSLNDIGYFNTWLLKTPMLYIMTFSLFFGALCLSKYLEKKGGVTYLCHLFSIGFLLSGTLFTQLRFQNPFGFVQVLGISAIWAILIFGLFRQKSLWNKMTVFAQMFDASATFTAMQFYTIFHEQHVAPNLLFDLAGGPWIFFIAKAAVTILFLWAVEKDIQDKNLRNFLKLVVIILGLGQGTRDMLMIVGFG